MPVALHPAVPNVYRRIRREDEKAALRLVRTDIAGFVGYAERGPLPDRTEGDPAPAADGEAPESGVRRLTSWAEFVAHYGGCNRKALLGYAVRAFFENGGEVCYVARVAALGESDPLKHPAAARAVLPVGNRRTKLKAALPPRGAKLVQELRGVDPCVQPGDLIEIAIELKKETDEKKGEEAGDETGLKPALFLRLVTGRDCEAVHLDRPIAAPPPEVNPGNASISISIKEPGLILFAKTPGTWGNRIRGTITPLPLDAEGASTEFALRAVFEPLPGEPGGLEEEFFPRLSLNSKSEYRVDRRLRDYSNLLRTDALPDKGSDAATPKLPRLGDAAPALQFILSGGSDGLASVKVEDFIGGPADRRGLRLFEDNPDIAILCVPDAVLVVPPPEKPHPAPKLPCQPEREELPVPPPDDPPIFDNAALLRIQLAMLDQCERLRDRFAILDFPEKVAGVAELIQRRNSFRSPFGALYYPWLQVPEPAGGRAATRAVPPCGHVAGTFAQLDRAIGVHQPPANVELKDVTDLASLVDDDLQQELNPRSINALRAFSGRGIRVWGVRSLAGTDQAEWRFIHARRFMSMLEESIEKSMKWAVFETNDQTLRQTVRHIIDVFLERVWRRGGLKGDRREQAYYVKCDETNNPFSTTERGQLLCEVGVAIAAPMEFIVFELRPAPSGNELELRQRNP